MNSFLVFVQTNSFLCSLFVAFVVGSFTIYFRFRDMGKEIHQLNKRLVTIEQERLAHLEALSISQGNTLSIINERTQSMKDSLSRIETHLMEPKK